MRQGLLTIVSTRRLTQYGRKLTLKTCRTSSGTGSQKQGGISSEVQKTHYKTIKHELLLQERSIDHNHCE